MKIKKEIYEEMISWMKENIPIEACGILVGRNDTVDEFIKMENIAKSEKFFEMDPLEVMKVFEDIDNRSKEVVGIFHSHPVSDPYPSVTDLERNEVIDHLIFVISSMRTGKPELKAFTINNKTVKEVEVEIID
ncbi:MAG: M67 family metallopeptidase [Brevinematia bacterium]